MAFNLTVGQRESARSVIDITSTSEATDGDSPSETATVVSGLSADIIATVDEVAADAITMTARYENLSATTEVGQPAVDELKDKMTQMRFSPRGRMLDAPGGKAQTEQQLTAFVTPFPDEDIGAGARWRAWSPLDAAGIKMCSVTTYALDKFDGHAHESAGDSKIVVEPGTTQQETFGMTITIEARGGEGTGSTRTAGNLNSFYPDSGESSSMNFTVASSAQGAGVYVLTTDQSMKATFSRIGA